MTTPGSPALDALPTATLDADGRLAPEVPCVRCGYALRGLLPADACPECGASASASLDPSRLWWVSERFGRRTAWGFALAAAGWLPLAVAPVWVYAVFPAAALQLISAILLFVASPPGERSQHPRAALGLSLIGTIMLLLISGGMRDASAAILMFLVGVGSFGALAVVQVDHAHKLATAIPHHGLVRWRRPVQAWIVAATLLGIVGLCLLAYFSLLQIYSPTTLSASQSWFWGEIAPALLTLHLAATSLLVAGYCAVAAREILGAGRA